MANIFFKSQGHKERFMAIMEQLGRIYDSGPGPHYDQEYSAALYILTSDANTWKQAQKYVDNEDIDIELMLAEVGFSSGYIKLIKLAGNLFNSGQHIEPIDFCAVQLDDSNFLVALQAMRLRRDSLRVADLEESKA